MDTNNLKSTINFEEPPTDCIGNMILEGDYFTMPQRAGSSLWVNQYVLEAYNKATVWAKRIKSGRRVKLARINVEFRATACRWPSRLL
jgi:hypothetical protein